jgi:hypothetical protein
MGEFPLVGGLGHGLVEPERGQHVGAVTRHWQRQRHVRFEFERFFLEPLAHRRQQVAADSEHPEMRFGRRHDDPRRLRSGRLADERLADLYESVVQPEIRPFGFGHTPARAGVLLE